MRFKYYSLLILLSVVAVFSSCKSDDDTILKNDFLKRTTGPNLVGANIDLSYILAVPGSRLDMAYVEASIAGEVGTGFEKVAYKTNPKGGAEIPILVAKDCTTEGNKSQAVFLDTMVVALRYHYIIPNSARGKKVWFRFVGTAKNGERVSCSTPEYTISKMNIAKGIVVSSKDRCYISLKQRAAFTLAEVQAQGLADQIDLIYNYCVVDKVKYNHALFAPGADDFDYSNHFKGTTVPDYKEDAIVPDGAKNISQIERVVIFDRQLAYGKGNTSSGAYSFVDDIDFDKLNVGSALPFVFDFTARQSAWIVTADGKCRAFIQINELTPSGTMTISMKTYDL